MILSLGGEDPCNGGSSVEIVFESEEEPQGFMLKTPGDGDLSAFSVEPSTPPATESLSPPTVQITSATLGLGIPSLNIIPSTPVRSRSPAMNTTPGIII